MTDRPVRLAALADLHCDRNCQGSLHALFESLAERADVVLLCGDLTHHGTVDEAGMLVRELAPVRVPVLAVLGNHDHQSGVAGEVTRVLADGGVRMLDGDTYELQGIGFAGVKGFCGGFGTRMLEPWGEAIIKRFVREAVEETLKLESALSRIASEVRVVLTHYAPIEATVVGEPLELYAYLGTSRLEEPLNRYRVAACFHGHAHHGTAEGRTSAGVPVYNVSMTLLHAQHPDRAPVRFVEIEAAAPAPAPAHGAPRDLGPVTRLPAAPQDADGRAAAQPVHEPPAPERAPSERAMGPASGPGAPSSP
ncbi:MAG TPA: metallophosphoesterase [Candidatus Eisenbacteria bacterium]|nr:metallophosphoesterase [Candidatus Eisenbacteria bacterium]